MAYVWAYISEEISIFLKKEKAYPQSNFKVHMHVRGVWGHLGSSESSQLLERSSLVLRLCRICFLGRSAFF